MKALNILQVLAHYDWGADLSDLTGAGKQFIICHIHCYE